MIPAGQRCLSVLEVAERLGLSPDVVRTKFRQVEGVILIRSHVRTTLRIPEAIFDRWCQEHAVKR